MIVESLTIAVPVDARNGACELDYLRRTFAAEFGGATTTHTSGDWVADDGQLVSERIALVRSTYDPDAWAGIESATVPALEFGRYFAARLATACAQDCVLVEHVDHRGITRRELVS